MSWELVAGVFGLAVLDMVSPALIGVSIYVVLRRPRWVFGLLGTYLGTVAVLYFLLGVGLMFGLSAAVSFVDETVARWIQAALGAALLIGSWWVPTERKRNPAAGSGAFTARRMLVLGLGTWVIEFATAIPFFGAVGLMTSAGLTPAEWLPLLALYVLIMVLPGLAIVAVWAIMGDRVQGRLERWRTKLADRGRAWLPWVVGILGFLVLRDAVVNLFLV